LIRRHSQNIRPEEHPKSAETPSVLALKLRDALDRHKATREGSGS
jgi:hypothetical protein